MKKMLSLLLVLGMVTILVSACGKPEAQPEVVNPEQTTTEQTDQTATEPETTTKPADNSSVTEDKSTPEDTTSDVTEDNANQDASQSEQPLVGRSDNEWFTEVVSAKVVSQSEGSMEWINKNGETVSFSNGGGKLYLVDVWAQWCPPCRASTPTMIAMYNKYKDSGLVVLGDNVDDSINLEVAKEFAIEEGIAYPVLHDPKSSKIAGIY
ncbi:MAG: TlpA family protein disulfide reductase, partial [Caldiserica bacterium]|nr:TlpA family protein disulfide reductase [Caldisericota bacterium]